MNGKITSELIELLEPRLQELELEKADVDRDISLLDQGILDSLSFLEFLSQIEEKYDIEFDFEAEEPSGLNSIHKLEKRIFKWK